MSASTHKTGPAEDISSSAGVTAAPARAVERLADCLEDARRLLEQEAGAIAAAAARLSTDGPENALGKQMVAAVECILNTDRDTAPGSKLVVTGIGKSGLVARSLAATLQSTGTPAVFLHPAEASHGDLGICRAGDPVLMISKSGSTAELNDLVRPFREMGATLIGILGNTNSPLATQLDIVLDASVAREADPEGFLPSASTAVAMAVGHALAVALMRARGFTAEDFARLHSGGQLGRNLRVRVADAMHSNGEVAWVGPEDSLKSVVIAMSRFPLGAACVVEVAGERGDRLLGLVTDGDVRRALETHDDIRTLSAADIMTHSPLTIGPDALLNQALAIMEDRPSQISVLPVVDAAGACLGLLRLHDIYQPAAAGSGSGAASSAVD